MARRQRVALTLHPTRHGAYWALTIRTEDGHRLSDRRLSYGFLPYAAGAQDPGQVIPLLQRAVWALERKHGLPSAAQRSPGAPGGDGGRDESDRSIPRYGDGPPAGSDLDRPLPGL